MGTSSVGGKFRNKKLHKTSQNIIVHICILSLIFKQVDIIDERNLYWGGPCGVSVFYLLFFFTFCFNPEGRRSYLQRNAVAAGFHPNQEGATPELHLFNQFILISNKLSRVPSIWPEWKPAATNRPFADEIWPIRTCDWLESESVTCVNSWCLLCVVHVVIAFLKKNIYIYIWLALNRVWRNRYRKLT